MVKSLLENTQLFQQIANKIEMRRQKTSDDILLSDHASRQRLREELATSPAKRDEILARAKNCMNAIAKARHLLKDPARTPLFSRDRVQIESKKNPKANSNVLHFAKPPNENEDTAHIFTFSNGFYKQPVETPGGEDQIDKEPKRYGDSQEKLVALPDQMDCIKVDDSPMRNSGVAGTRRLKGYSRPRVAFTPGFSQMFFGPLDGTVSTGQL
jgi:hypothetical protein